MIQVPANVDSQHGKDSESTGPSRRRVLTLVAVGNVFEWYDFTVYGLFAPQIAATFFPSQDPLVGLLLAFLVFFIGFCARPIGGLVFGRLVDRRGR